jgi:hypothetical protein
VSNGTDNAAEAFRKELKAWFAATLTGPLENMRGANVQRDNVELLRSLEEELGRAGTCLYRLAQGPWRARMPRLASAWYLPKNGHAPDLPHVRITSPSNSLVRPFLISAHLHRRSGFSPDSCRARILGTMLFRAQRRI